jgi:hypothetical protein
VITPSAQTLPSPGISGAGGKAAISSGVSSLRAAAQTVNMPALTRACIRPSSPHPALSADRNQIFLDGTLAIDSD